MLPENWLPQKSMYYILQREAAARFVRRQAFHVVLVNGLTDLHTATSAEQA